MLLLLQLAVSLLSLSSDFYFYFANTKNEALLQTTAGLTPLSPFTPAFLGGGGSLSVLLTLYKAGGALLLASLPFSYFFFYDAQIVDFKL